MPDVTLEPTAELPIKHCSFYVVKLKKNCLTFGHIAGFYISASFSYFRKAMKAAFHKEVPGYNRQKEYCYEHVEIFSQRIGGSHKS